MLSIFLFIIAILFTFVHLAYKKNRSKLEVFLSYLLFFNMGVMGLLAAYAHLFRGPEIAHLIGWPAGNPFQFEIGMANLSYGVLGILAYWMRGRFWEAAIIGWSLFLLGCFVEHFMEFTLHNNAAPLNIGIFVWFNDLILPVLALAVLFCYRKEKVSA